MPYLLHHYFEPSMDARVLRPKELEGGRVDHRDLGYVQNVVMEQVIAEFKPVGEDEVLRYDPRFIYQTPSFPMGANVKTNPADPNQLVAETNGHACYEDGLLTVTTTLIIDEEIGPRTGNILFVGDLRLRRDVRDGFEVHARTVLVDGVTGAATVKAERSIGARGGIKGGHKGVLDAGANIRSPFCENAEILARENVLIEGACMHCNLFVGKQLAVKGRLTGGTVYCGNLVFVGQQLGGGTSTQTRLSLGYDPFLFRQAQALDAEKEKTEERIRQYEQEMKRADGGSGDMASKLERARQKLAIYDRRREQIWDKINASATTRICRVAVPGEVQPGLEVTIGHVSLKVDDYLENVRFELDGDEIAIRKPALKK